MATKEPAGAHEVCCVSCTWQGPVFGADHALWFPKIMREPQMHGTKLQCLTYSLPLFCSDCGYALTLPSRNKYVTLFILQELTVKKLCTFRKSWVK